MKPATYVGMVRHRRVDGREHLRGQFDRDTAIAAGTQVLLRRDGSDYVLQFVRPGKPWNPTKRERAAVELSNAPRGALRRDPRHEPEDMP